MDSMAGRLWRDERGVIISAEMVLILTIVVLGVLVGLVQVRNAVVAELTDLGQAFSHLNQSYSFAGFHGGWKPSCGWTSWTAGSCFVDDYVGVASIADIGVGASSGGGDVVYGCGACSSAAARFGTIVLADGTLIPLRLVSTGTWALPGGAVLAEFSSRRGYLLLADGTSIPFLLGICGTVELADGTRVAARPGALGTLVLSDGRTATFSATDRERVALADGTLLRFYAAGVDEVILADGTPVVVKTGEPGTLALPDGRVLHLRDAVLPPGTEHLHPMPDAVLAPPEGPVPEGACCQPACPTPCSPAIPVPGPAPQLLPSPQMLPQPDCPERHKGPQPKTNVEIPAGPIPQHLPQV
jgi:Flp pilus assembly pilin Flp